MRAMGANTNPKNPALNIPVEVARNTGPSACWMAATLATPVEIVTTDARAVLLPLACKDVGENEHVAFAGRPLQLIAIEPVKPLLGVILIVTLPADCGPTCRDCLESETAKSGLPVTVNDACAEVRPELLA